MRSRVTRIAALATAVATLGVALAQEPDAKKGDPAKKAAGAKGKRKGGLLAGGAIAPKGAAAKGDALGKAQGKEAPPRWPYHVRFRLTNSDGITQTATYYPSRGGDGAPVLLLVHQGGAGHSARDFEEPIEAFEGKTLAEHLQGLDYAVLIPELRLPAAAAAPVANPNPEPDANAKVKAKPKAPRGASEREIATLAADLRAAYLFLIDRHNLRELNVGRLGVIGFGDGATVAAAWAAAAYPTGPIANPGRLSDVGALVLVSPTADAGSLKLAPAVTTLAPRLPILVIATEKDEDVAKTVEPQLQRPRLASKVERFESRLQGDRLLRFEPKAVEAIAKFLEDPVKFRSNSDWEPRYLLTPVAYSDIETISSKKAAEPAKKEAAEKEAAEPAKKKAAEPAEKE
jgi:pimeloyl-ACP methyl ester carboxylesterase